MPMLYVSKWMCKLLEKPTNLLRRGMKSSVRPMKSDIIHETLKEYAKKLGVNANENLA